MATNTTSPKSIAGADTFGEFKSTAGRRCRHYAQRSLKPFAKENAKAEKELNRHWFSAETDCRSSTRFLTRRKIKHLRLSPKPTVDVTPQILATSFRRRTKSPPKTAMPDELLSWYDAVRLFRERI
jgi:hypothetical protein